VPNSNETAYAASWIRPEMCTASLESPKARQFPKVTHLREPLAGIALCRYFWPSIQGSSRITVVR